MVFETRGVLVETDAVMKQFLLYLNQEHHFIVEYLDETHLLISSAPHIQQLIIDQVDALQKKNTYEPPTSKEK